MISERSKLSLSQFLELQDRDLLETLFQKHGLSTANLRPNFFGDRKDLFQATRDSVLTSTPEQLAGLMNEMLRTSRDLRSRVSPRYRYDERYADLCLCLELDGYTVQERELRSVEPRIEGAEPLEDSLSAELRRSRLQESEDVLGLIQGSADAYRRHPPGYNDCLTNARVALQTLAAGLARARSATHPGSFDAAKWGEVLRYLRASAFVTTEEEAALAGVFRFLSPGAHRPIAASEAEMARLSRSLALSMCYFLVRLFNG